MGRDAAFWRWYAEVSDSVRHDVIERGWFERKTTQDITDRDMPGMKPEHEAEEDQAWDYAPEPEEEIEPEQEP